MGIRAKFWVSNKDPGDTGLVQLIPVTSSDPEHENKTFWDATPSGEFIMYISNPQAFKQFELGAEYYIDFTKVDQGGGGVK